MPGTSQGSRAPAQPESSSAAQEPTRPTEAVTPEERAKKVGLGDVVLVTLSNARTRVQRPATVVAVWPGSHGAGAPPGVNVLVHLDGSNDNAALAVDKPDGLALHQARRALVCETCQLWLTDVRYGAGVGEWEPRGY